MEAIQRAESELQLYKDPQTTGSLRTYDISSIHSGARLIFSVPSLDLSGSALVNNVMIDFRDHAGDKPVATVNFSPIKDYGIIDYLTRPAEEDEEDIAIARQASVAGIVKTTDSFTMSDTVSVVSGTLSVEEFPRNPFTGLVVNLTKQIIDFSWDSGIYYSSDSDYVRDLDVDSSDIVYTISGHDYDIYRLNSDSTRTKSCRFWHIF